MTTEVIPNGGGVPEVGLDGSPAGHTEKMLAMGAPKEGEEGYVAPVDDQVAQRPDDVPEKFWDAEKGVINTAALLKSQADAEAALRGQAKPEPKEGEEGYVAPVAPAANQQGVVDAASAEWTEKGELSEETFVALEGAGLSRDMVKDYIAGQTAIVGNLRDAAFNVFDSGQEGYEEAANWAAENLDANEIQALDVQLTSNNPAIVAQGAKALAARFERDGDREPSTIRGNANNSAVGGVYTSSREMMKDMNSSKYKTDAAFRAQVAAKLSRSNI